MRLFLLTANLINYWTDFDKINISMDFLKLIEHFQFFFFQPIKVAIYLEFWLGSIQSNLFLFIYYYI